MANERLGFVTALQIISEVEKSPYKRDRNFLIKLLGKETFKTMAAAGHISGGFTLHNGEVVKTYAPTKSFRAWADLVE